MKTVSTVHGRVKDEEIAAVIFIVVIVCIELFDF